MANNNGDGKKKYSISKDLRMLLPASSIGLVFVSSIVIGALIGVWIDGKLNTKPWFTLFFIVIGIISGIKNAYMFYKKAERLAIKNEEDQNGKNLPKSK